MRRRRNIRSLQREKDTYPIIEKELKKWDFYTISDEFGIELDNYKPRVDVFGCKWNSKGDKIETIGIEVKYLPNESINFEFSQGIGQCINYLPFFKYVVLCCREGKIGEYWENIREELTVNRVSLDFHNLDFPNPNELKQSRFNKEGASKNILLRSSMIISFYESFKDRMGDIESGEFRNGGGWLAVNFKNHLQINIFYSDKSINLGFNIERRDPFHSIIKKVAQAEKEELKKLFEDNGDMSIRFSKDIKTKKEDEFLLDKNTILSMIKNEDINQLILHKIGDILREKQYRPHLTIYIKLWDTVKDKQWHIQKINEGKERLMKFVNFFEKLV